MKREQTSWSVFTDSIEGPCVVCGGDVRYMMPADRPDPAFLYHSTCDPIMVIRQRLKGLTIARLPVEYTAPAAAAAVNASPPPEKKEPGR